jgi:hypothetical protein
MLVQTIPFSFVSSFMHDSSYEIEADKLFGLSNRP